MDRTKNELGAESCEVCGNYSRECFAVHLGREKHVFDTFECAMSAMLPRCSYCKCRITGDGVPLGEGLFCSYACANDGYVRAFEGAVLMREQSQL